MNFKINWWGVDGKLFVGLVSSISTLAMGGIVLFLGWLSL